MRLNRDARQRIIDDYLAASGAETLRAGEFLDWLEPQREHPVWPVFFGRDEAQLARERREQLVQRFVSDLRIRIRYSAVSDSGVTTIRVAEVPAFVSPVEWRSAGGGYRCVDGESALADLRREGVRALRAWLARYGGAFELDGASLAALHDFVAEHDTTAVPAVVARPRQAAGA